ncbi:DUF4112 domain-containing protein [Microvirga pudoricolor]|uniref:DUF4112 domain-containing protein n=1 Tax=Microvirga pudoricolor TaxID=2778729 RepID=UPI00194E2341|nr:DUF4112 domain-containing protein [Microvirga pudoricolor]MBM6592515.1 DUF4112 domain-containing protein [Microvirga pudoricolor]
MATFSYASSFDPSSRAQGTRARLDTLARLLDSALRVPGTNIRFGADAILNLVPGFGLLTSKGMSAYLIWEAHRLGVPASTIMKMVRNVGIDFVISAVPVVGWMADVFYRSNLRNMSLLRQHLDRTHPLRMGDDHADRRGGRR